MGFVAMFAWSSRYLPAGVSPLQQVGSLSYYVLRILEQLPVFSIPAFLFVSGYFIAISTSRAESSVGWNVVFSRIKHLFIPYIIWSSVAILLSVATGGTYSFLELLKILLTGEASEVLYYVPLLIQFYILSPLLVRLAKKNWMVLLLVTGILQTFVQALTYQILFDVQPPVIITITRLIPKWFFLSRIFWFPLGIVFGFHASKFKPILERLRTWLVALTLIFIPLIVLEWELLYRSFGEEWLPHRETVPDNIYSLVVILAILAWVKLPSGLAKPISALGTKSYGIFLTHSLFIEYTAKVIYRVAPALLGIQAILLPVFIIAGLVGPLLIMAVVDRSFLRKAYNILYG